MFFMPGFFYFRSPPVKKKQSEKHALLAQLVQSTASTRQGSVVRAHYSAQGAVFTFRNCDRRNRSLVTPKAACSQRKFELIYLCSRIKHQKRNEKIYNLPLCFYNLSG